MTGWLPEESGRTYHGGRGCHLGGGAWEQREAVAKRSQGVSEEK